MISDSDNNKIVIVKGEKYRIEVFYIDAIYPYKHKIRHVYATPLNLDLDSYKKTKLLLGDNWSIDVLNSPEFESALENALTKESA